MKITLSLIPGYEESLVLQEKSHNTVSKYIRDVKKFVGSLKVEPLSKVQVMEYKDSLISEGYAINSINSMLASVNSFLKYISREDCRVRHMKQQRNTYHSAEEELTKEEYERLLEAAADDERLYMILQTICATGIRVSELVYITVSAVENGMVEVSCKNKTRIILLPEDLCRELTAYISKKGLTSGPVFVTKSGRPVSRTSIWASMKKLCRKAGILPAKVFPHNLRKLFARIFYSLEKDIAKLADALGHSRIETTRRYIMTTRAEHQAQINRMGLVRKREEEGISKEDNKKPAGGQEMMANAMT